MVFRTLASEPRALLSGDVAAYFLPFRTIAVYPFSFPFGRKVNLRSAISLTFRPLLGAEESKLSLLPQVTEQRSNLTKGSVWFAAKDEIAAFEEMLGKEAAFLPAPVAFASEVGGTGLLIWRDEGGAAALWLEDYAPRLYKYMSEDEGGSEELVQFARSYAQAVGGSIEAESVRLYDARDLSGDALANAAEKSFAASPALAHLDFSNVGASLAEQYEKFFSASFRALKLAAAAAVVFFILSAALLVQNGLTSASFEAAPGAVYALAMGEESRSPISSITKKLKLLNAGGVQLAFNDVLANIASAWKGMPAGSDAELDAIRSGRERTELEGRTAKTETIEKLRAELSKNGFVVKLGDVQQIPGSVLRFTLYLTEGGR
ncbi:MAG: type II secretion system protein GspL [Cloacibacillus sp.]